jgi:hypothetical protein
MQLKWLVFLQVGLAFDFDYVVWTEVQGKLEILTGAIELVLGLNIFNIINYVCVWYVLKGILYINAL